MENGKCNVKRAAKLLNRTPASVYNYIRSGLLRVHVVRGRKHLETQQVVALIGRMPKVGRPKQWVQ